MSGAQWDFDGNGSWDTDMSQANGTTTHVYSNNGTYTVKLQLKMSDGTTTNICSKSVTVPSGFNVKMTGRVYEDVNCNDMQEPDEKGISGVTVSFYLMPSWTHYADVTSDSNGYYELSRNLSPGDSLTIQPANVAPAGYKIHDDGHTITLNAAQPSINMDLPQVPASSVGQCQ
jgi:PKD repeat protein